MGFKTSFFPGVPPSEEQLSAGRKRMMAESAVSDTIFSLGTGNFIAGFMILMGATPSFCALVAALPQLGCVLQLVSPFLFERLRHRKLCIVLLCFGFRFSLALTAVIPFVFAAQQMRLGAIFALYFVAFMLAGFVTPGLNQWMLGIAPASGRGKFYAKKDILSSLCNAAITLAMGLQLDYWIGQGKAMAGYMVVFAAIFILTLIDVILLSRIAEIPSEHTIKLSPRDFAAPFKNKEFRPIIVFLSLRFAAYSFSASFLSVYLLSGLGLEHGFISFTLVLAAGFGMCASWVWGVLADKRGWKWVLLSGCVLAALACAGWFFVTPAVAVFAAPVLQCLTVGGNSAFGSAGLNLQYATSPQNGKTVYFGVVAAVSNLAGYIAAATAAVIQPILGLKIGMRSISVLFLASAVGMVLCVIIGKKRLPDC